jgi:hypothetical protein
MKMARATRPLPQGFVWPDKRSPCVMNLTALSRQVNKATMSSKRTTVLDVLFPRVRAEILRLLFAEPQQPRYVRELMNMSGLALHTIQDELRKLSAAGLLLTWSNGYHRFYRANPDHPLFESLSRIVHDSVKLPLAKQKLLRQFRRRRQAKLGTGRREVPMPKDWPVKWNLFSHPRPT